MVQPHPFVFRLIRPLLLACLGCMLLAGARTAFAADEQARAYNVPSGDAVETLKQAAQQGGFQIMFPAEIVRGVTTHALSGQFTPGDALNTMLAGTVLYVVKDDASSVYSVQRMPAADKPAVGSKQPKSDTADGAAVQLSPFEVSERATHGYLATSTVSATRLNTPIAELSKSITVITRDMLNDLAVTELNQALYMSSSVSFTSPYSGRVAVRGFENAAAKRDGLGNYGSDETITDTATIERIEVVKGPSSLLYGSSSPGGVVNYVTKKPLSHQEDSITLTAGSFGKHRAVLDSGGPLIGDGNVLNYRLVAAYDENKNFGRYNGHRRSVVAGSARWYLNRNTYLMLGAEFDQGDSTNIRPGVFPDSRALFDANGKLIHIHDHFDMTKTARDDWVGAWSGPYNRHHSRVQRYDAELFHQFTDELSLFAHYSYIDNTLEEAYSISTAEGWNPTAFATPGPGQMNMQGFFRNPHRKSGNGTVTLSYDLKRDAFETQFIAGWEFYSFVLNQGDNAQNAQYFNMVNMLTGAGYERPWPNTLGGVLDAVGKGEWAIWDRYHRTQNYNAPYLLVHSYLLDRRLRLIAGIRQDKIKIRQVFRGKDNSSPDPYALAAPTFTNSNASATTPMFGASFAPMKAHPGLSVFANYSESLVANEIVNPDGSGLPPEKGKGTEVGVKLDSKDKLSMTLSWYSIDRTNLARGVPNTVPQRWEAAGLQRSKGVDLDLFYAVTPDWQVIANAALDNARVIDDATVSLNGTRIGGVPATSWSAWTKYSFSSGPLKGFDVGGGVVSRTSTEVYGASYPGLVAPGYQRVDLLFGYRTKFNGRDMAYSLKINNLFDKVYLEGVNGWGMPLSYELSVTMKF